MQFHKKDSFTQTGNKKRKTKLLRKTKVTQYKKKRNIQ